MDKVLQDPLYAFMFYETDEAKRKNEQIKQMFQNPNNLTPQEAHYQAQRELETQEIFAQMVIEEAEQLSHMENKLGYAQLDTSYTPNYASYTPNKR